MSIGASVQRVKFKRLCLRQRTGGSWPGSGHSQLGNICAVSCTFGSASSHRFSGCSRAIQACGLIDGAIQRRAEVTLAAAAIPVALHYGPHHPLVGVYGQLAALP